MNTQRMSILARIRAYLARRRHRDYWDSLPWSSRWALRWTKADEYNYQSFLARQRQETIAALIAEAEADGHRQFPSEQFLADLDAAQKIVRRHMVKP